MKNLDISSINSHLESVLKMYSDVFRKHILFLAATIILCGVSVSFSQELREYYIECDQQAFDYLISHPEENDTVDCDFEFDGQTWNDVALTLSEYEYRYFPKKSFKADFPDENLFHERDKMNLMAEWNDPSFAREYISMQLFESAGLPAQTCWYAKLFINGDYYGLFLDKEEVDEKYLERIGYSEDASIYKADTTGCFLRPEDQIDQVWDKITNTSTGYIELENLITWLDTEFDERYYDNLSRYFDPIELAKVISLNSLAGNRSTYYTNYYLIQNHELSNLWLLIPNNLDSTFSYSDGYSEPYYYRAGHEYLSETNALITRCWENEPFRSEIFAQLDWICENFFNEVYLQDITDSLSSLLYDAVDEDPNKQFSSQDFLASLSAIPGEASQRSLVIGNEIDNHPLPFDLKMSMLTPVCEYFSWDLTYSNSGEPIEYTLQIADDYLFTQNLIEISTGANTSYLDYGILPGQYYWRVIAETNASAQTFSISPFAEISIPEEAFIGTTVTGNISVSTTWSIEGSPYSLPEGLIIEDDAVLTIEPGVIVGIGPRQSIIIDGGLEAVGTMNDSIYFVPLNPDTNWGAFQLDRSSDEINVSFVNMTFSGNPESTLPLGALFTIYESNVNIFDSKLSNGVRGVIDAYGGNVHCERIDFHNFIDEQVLLHYGSAIFRSCKFTNLYLTQGDIIDLNQIHAAGEISRCEFFGGGDDLLDLGGVSNLEISCNKFLYSNDKGISIDGDSHSLSIYNNFVLDCNIGIAIKTMSSAELFNNVIASNDTGFAILREPGLSGVVRIKNSVLWNNGLEVYHFLNDTVDIQYSYVEGNDVYPGTGNLNSDPMFVDPWNDYFYLCQGSPLIDAGYGTGYPELDFIDSARTDIESIPNTGAGEIDYVDIGLYEYYETNLSAPLIEDATPSSYLLLGNYPNPFNSVTKINFTVGSGDWAEITIYNVLGRKVYSREFKDIVPGKYSMLWNGRDDGGNPLASGILFCRLKAERGTRISKIVLLK